MMLVVRNVNWQQAPSSDQLSFNLAVFSSARKRTDPISFASGSMQANDAAAFVSVPNIKYFTSASITSYNVIIGAQQTQQITGATVTLGGQARWSRDIYGYRIETQGHPSGANWSLIDLTWNFN